MKEGIFWIIGKNKDALAKGDFEAIVHFERDTPHIVFWEKLKYSRKEFKLFEYDYFPRGRIWYNESATIILINPILDMPAVIKKIKELFELSGKVQIHGDGYTPPQKL